MRMKVYRFIKHNCLLKVTTMCNAVAMRGHHVTLFEDGMGLSGQGDGTILTMPGTSGGQPSQGTLVM